MLQEFVAVVTGGGGDIGRAIASRLSQAGMTVAVIDIDGESAAETVRQLKALNGRALAFEADISAPEHMERCVAGIEARLGMIGVFVNNAGREGDVAPLSNYSDDVFDSVMAVNAKGTFLGMKHALRRMIPRGSGSVVNIASTSAIRGRAGLAGYVASKHAVLGLTRVGALDAADTGVRVNAVLPGPVEGRMIWALDQRASQGDMRRAGAVSYAKPEDVANTVAFLGSDEAVHINGSALVVDGGATVL